FFTRRVGARLPDGVPQRVLFGGKLTGKLEAWSLGMLDAVTERTRFLDPGTLTTQTAPQANFFVLRLQRDIFRNSSFGLLTANRDQSPADIGSRQRVHAADLNIVAGPHIRWTSQMAYNQNHTTTRGGIHRLAAFSQFFYNSDRWVTGAGYKYLGRGFDVSDLGFEPETDRHSSFAFVRYQPFLNRHALRQVFFEVNQDISLDTSGLTQDSGSDADLSALFKNFWGARVRYSYDVVRFNAFTGQPNCAPPPACQPAFTALDATRAYVIPRVRFFLNSNAQRPVFFNYAFTWQKFAQFAENFYGRGSAHDLGLEARLLGRTRVQLRGLWVREFLLDGTPFQNRRLFVARVHYQ
ncbi:MAG: DUF5916 domain-containing protein, partial [Terriglobales bacterium]